MKSAPTYLPTKQVYVFEDEPVQITDSDVHRLLPHLRNWNGLSDLMLLGTVSNDDLRRLVILELKMDKPRMFILKKLAGRLTSAYRQKTLTAIAAAELAGK
jgi:hypothetical protein